MTLYQAFNSVLVFLRIRYWSLHLKYYLPLPNQTMKEAFNFCDDPVNRFCWYFLFLFWRTKHVYAHRAQHHHPHHPGTFVFRLFVCFVCFLTPGVTFGYSSWRKIQKNNSEVTSKCCSVTPYSVYFKLYIQILLIWFLTGFPIFIFGINQLPEHYENVRSSPLTPLHDENSHS